MLRATKRVKRKKNLIFKLAIVLIIAFIATQLVFLQINIANKRQQLTTLQQQVKTETEKNNQMQQQLDNGITNDYIEQIARNKLGLVSPSERIFMDVQ